MKRCTKCGEKKELVEFSFDKRREDGHTSECRPCRAIMSRTHFEAHKEQKRKSGRKWIDSNKERVRANTAKWYRNNRFRKALTNSKADERRCGYVPCNATVEELKASFTGRCGICGVPELECTKHLVMDHDHKTGEFRGWLCSKCNLALGGFGDNEDLLVNALHYLMSHQHQK